MRRTYIGKDSYSYMVTLYEKEGARAMKPSNTNKYRLYEQEKKRIDEVKLSFSDREKALRDLARRLKI
jgi:hypothetical protein